MENKKELSPDQRIALISLLKARFEKNMNRHKGLDWGNLQAKLEARGMYSVTTTVHPHTMPPGVFAVR